MSSFEWNKIIASVLTALIVAMVAGILSNMLVQPKPLEKPVFLVAGPPATSAPAEQAAAPKLAPITPLLAKADPRKGEAETKVCQVCHTFNKGEPNKIGPNLFGVTGGPIGEDRGGFAFSDALEAHKGQKWDPETLNQWLNNPQQFAPGTKMTFAGFPKAEDRADVIAYLQSLK
ncbi:MAG TPA: cytochrome c family protein [Stellaceae bacterium]|jgi:cytochrome c|nr:cytochrome c family protein [Stellaceae bacterium]